MADSNLSPPAPAPPPPRTLESGDMVWEVNRILAVRRHGRGFHYLVDWVGYGPEDRTWVPRSYFADPSLLGDFYRANSQAIGQSPGVSLREGGPVAGAPVATSPDQVPSMSSQSSISRSCTSSRTATRTLRSQYSGLSPSLPMRGKCFVLLVKGKTFFLL